jgi:hypothetical protein
MIYNMGSDSLPFVQTLRYSWKFLCKIAPSVGFVIFMRESTNPPKIQLNQLKGTFITNIYHNYHEISSIIKAIIMINKILSWIQTFLENWTLDTNVPNAEMIFRNTSFYVFVLQSGGPVTYYHIWILNAIDILCISNSFNCIKLNTKLIINVLIQM